MPSGRRNEINARQGRAAYVGLVAVIAAALFQVAWYYPRLPTRVASHFNAAGEANAFMPKGAFVLFQLGVVGFLALIFLAVPAIVTLLPPSLINLPNKDYWLAPARCRETLRTLRGFMLALGDAVLLFLVLVFGDAMRASLMPHPRMPMRIWFLLILLGVVTTLWTVRFLRRFRVGGR